MKGQLQELGYEVIWPYELFSPDEVASLRDAASNRIMERCGNALMGSDLIVAPLDGIQGVDGAAWNLAMLAQKASPLSG
ncbi:MAG: hypothetical protein K2H64_05480 [Desulfovibrio sp.]|nr:hypothetical protein [Desulfovibrio sp.]